MFCLFLLSSLLKVDHIFKMWSQRSILLVFRDHLNHLERSAIYWFSLHMSVVAGDSLCPKLRARNLIYTFCLGVWDPVTWVTTIASQALHYRKCRQEPESGSYKPGTQMWDTCILTSVVTARLRISLFPCSSSWWAKMKLMHTKNPTKPRDGKDGQTLCTLSYSSRTSQFPLKLA